MKLLLLSNSTNVGEPYLEYPKFQIKSFLGTKPVQALFIPYAAVTFSFDEYEARVKERFIEIGHDVIAIHHFNNPIDAVMSAEAIVIGGGNTFHLLKLLQQNNLLQIIREKVIGGLPYIGWSAGANMACPTICTTNDMPVVETNGLKALDLVPFQINPHYTNLSLSGHGGETRDQRIAEFLAANPFKTVVGLPEGSIIKYENKELTLIGQKNAKIFKYGILPYEVDLQTNLDFLIAQ
jgi:dipeptidase E